MIPFVEKKARASLRSAIHIAVGGEVVASAKLPTRVLSILLNILKTHDPKLEEAICHVIIVQ